MSETECKGLGEQLQEKPAPGSPTSCAEKAGENITGTYDKIVSSVREEDEKSNSQILGNIIQFDADSLQNAGKGVADSALDTVGNVVGAATDKVKPAIDYFTGAKNDVSDDTKSSRA